MIDIRNIEGVYFIGIGGIGMSALALYFSRGGFVVAGYDRTETAITRSLSEKGCEVIYDDDPGKIPSLFRKTELIDKILIVYTPAVPSDNRIISFFRGNGFRIFKRSEILGEISRHTDTLAVAGTHGKTTISTMIAHLLKQSQIDCSAFLGGISKNYDTNLLLGESNYTVMEADEFDRSFHRLHPLMAVITSVDEDHLDIYGDHTSLIEAYNEFCKKIRPGGKLFINSNIQDKIIVPEGIQCFTYGYSQSADYSAREIRHRRECFIFDIHTPEGVLKDINFPFPGIINIENLTAAVAVVLNCSVDENDIRKAVLLFKGVKRRFDIRVNLPGLTYIDDYAHHPEEIRAFITSVREFFRGRKITGIFQPHLFSRTRDHAAGFAAILDELDSALLLPVYPAREKPIPGVSSEMIFNLMKSPAKKLVRMDDLPSILDVKELDVLVTIGAGDIDRLVGPIEKKLVESNKK